MNAGGVSAASMLVSATSSNAILGGQQLAQAADVGATCPTNLPVYTGTVLQCFNCLQCMHGVSLDATHSGMPVLWYQAA